MKIINVKNAPQVTNTEQLPRGTGARYLECMTAHREDLPLIALRWRRTIPSKFDVLIDYHNEEVKP
jgi:hypothetical protein